MTSKSGSDPVSYNLKLMHSCSFVRDSETQFEVSLNEHRHTFYELFSRSLSREVSRVFECVVFKNQVFESQTLLNHEISHTPVLRNAYEKVIQFFHLLPIEIEQFFFHKNDLYHHKSVTKIANFNIRSKRSPEGGRKQHRQIIPKRNGKSKGKESERGS